MRPQKSRDIAIGLLASASSLGIGLAFFLDYLDNTIKTPEDVRKQLARARLAVIPGSAFPPTS